MATRKSPVEMAHELCQVMLAIEKFVSVNKAYMTRLEGEIRRRQYLFRVNRPGKIREELDVRAKELTVLWSRLEAVSAHFPSQSMSMSDRDILENYRDQLATVDRAFHTRARIIRNQLP